MVLIEEVETKETPKSETPSVDAVVSASEERFLDAKEIEEVAASMSRTSARVHLEGLAKKLRREGEALKRVEKSHSDLEESKSSQNTKDELSKESFTPVTAPTSPVAPISVPASPPVVVSSMKFTPINTFSFDAGSYNSPTVSIYISLEGVGSIPRDNIHCDFTSTSFDLTVKDLKGKNYRLLKDNLEKDIDPEKCKCIVKKERVILKLGKVKGEYGSYDSWQGLSAKKAKKDKKKSNDPSASIMELMKDMYDSGDDKMKKMIGETMMKQRNGELAKDGMGGLGGMDGLDDM